MAELPPIREAKALPVVPVVRALFDDIIRLVERGPAGDPAAFDELALRVFVHQHANNAPYRAYCDARGVLPGSVLSWRDVPAYPTDAFKRDIVASFPVEQAVLANMTSGTTAPNQRGRIFRDELGRDLIFTANRVMTAAYLFPDMAAGQRCSILLLTPSPELAPTMGMAIGMEQTRIHFGTPDSEFLVGRTGVDVKRLVRALRKSESTGVPVALVGATSAFVYFFKACAKKGMAFRLPAGSRICDGGGYRGRFGECTRQDYHRLAAEVAGVPEHMCVNTLGMAENATNYFDDSLRRAVLDLATPPREHRKVAPPWTRVQAFDPSTGEVLPHGQVGLLRHFDLCNLPTVLGVLTDNLGTTYADGTFEIIGRAKVVDGRVGEIPSQATVGPMGDTRVFRLLEAYVNFSIDFKMGRVSSTDRKSDHLELRRESDEQQGVDPGDPTASCPVAVDEMVAAADDPEAQTRADAAIAAFQAQGRADADARGGSHGVPV